MASSKIIPLLSLVFGLIVAGCCFGGPSTPSTPGVYLATGSGWQPLTGIDQNIYGTFSIGRPVSVDSLPMCVSPCRIVVVNMPNLDITRTRFGMVVDGRGGWEIAEQRHAPTFETPSEGVHATGIADSTLDSRHASVAAFVENGPGFNRRAFFFAVRGR